MNIRAFIPTIGKAPVHWLLEGLLIVISVALGFWATQFQQAREDRELAARLLNSLEAEIEHNRGVLEPYLPVHDKWVEALAKADTADSSKSGLDVFLATRPKPPAGTKAFFPFLRRSAWDAAVSGGTIRFIEHDVVSALSDIYEPRKYSRGIWIVSQTFLLQRQYSTLRAAPHPFDCCGSTWLMFSPPRRRFSISLSPASADDSPRCEF